MLGTWFDWIWWLGFIIAISSVYFLVTDEYFKNYILNHKSIILSYGIFHMVLLTLFGMFAIYNKADNTDIGHRVSTMGYLHTLIGTSVALILVSSNNSSESKDILNQMDLIIIPIGTALITSIIGWAVGTEMERPIFNTHKDSTLDGPLGDLASDIDLVGKTLQESTNVWRSSIDSTVQSLADSTKDLELKFERTLMLSSQAIEDNSNKIMGKYLSSFGNLFQQTEQQINTIQDNFDNTSTNAEKVMDNLILGFESIYKQMNDQASEIGVSFNSSSQNATQIMDQLLLGFEAILKQMNNQASEIEKSFSSSSISATQVIENLSLSYQELLDQTTNNVKNIETNLNESGNNADKAISKFIKSFESLFNSMQTYSDTMQNNFETSVDNAKKTIDKLALSFANVFTQMDTVSLQWEAHIKNMQNFAKGSSVNLNNLLTNSKIIAAEIQDVADAMPNSAQILREVDDILEVLRVIKEKEI